MGLEEGEGNSRLFVVSGRMGVPSMRTWRRARAWNRGRGAQRVEGWAGWKGASQRQP